MIIGIETINWERYLLNERKVKRLMREIKKNGQVVPVQLTRNYRLRKGKHILEALKRLNIPEVKIKFVN